jgi:1,4-dihydroxy-6-naphthoate synthase
MPLSMSQAKKTQPGALNLSLAHSPDSDDAFMFYALATRKIPIGNLRFTHQLEDIEALNQKAREGVYDLTAVSFHAYAYVADQYLLLTSGASFGDGYGPIIVSRASLDRKELKGKRVAIPGKMTTACLALRLYEPALELVVTPFDQILKKVADGEADAGVVIHEGQLTYGAQGLKKIADLGEWWKRETGLPLPLGGNVIRRSLPPEVRHEASRLLKASIEFALEHRQEALEYALEFARGLDAANGDQFVSMYVNHWTLDCGEAGRQAVQTLLDYGHAAGIIPQAARAEFVE